MDKESGARPPGNISRLRWTRLSYRRWGAQYALDMVLMLSRDRTETDTMPLEAKTGYSTEQSCSWWSRGARSHVR